MRDIDRFRGCLIGGAAGDALGYTVEFMREAEIFDRFGDSGITQYLVDSGRAIVSDDTQMTLFTAAALCRCNPTDTIDAIVEIVRRHYVDWFRTQAQHYPLNPGKSHSWLCEDARMFAHRAPGGTCLSALEMGGHGSVVRPINNSKGCGGVMRVAPIGLFYADTVRASENAAVLAAEAAAITHGHPLGWLPAAVLGHIVCGLAQGETSILQAVRDAVKMVCAHWCDEKCQWELRQIVDRAIALACSNTDDLSAIHEIGEGWVGEEALAIAIFCAIRHEDDFDGAIIAAVNHNGDSDSTGAITGNILGTKVGAAAIPKKYTDCLELLDIIEKTAEMLWRDA